MGDVQRRTPVQVSALVTMFAPVSPSTPTSLLLLMYQTMASAEPFVVVAIGAVTSFPASAAHHTTRGAGGEPGGINTDMITFPLGIPAGHTAPMSVENVTWTPAAVVYAAGTV